jgi:hypothetical protein
MRFTVLAVAVVLAAAAPARAQEGEGAPPAGDTATTSTVPPPSTLPPGCILPPPAAAVFVGRVEAKDVRTARFAVAQVRAGTLGGFQVAGMVDVDYGDDVRYLEIGERYLVGVKFDGDTGRLVSKVRAPAPLFGGNQVVGIDDADTACPEVEDPVQTLHLDGSTIDTGVLSPLFEERRDLLAAVALPALWAFAVLVALAALKGVIVGIGTGARRLWRGEPLLQTRPAPRSPRPR